MLLLELLLLLELPPLLELLVLLILILIHDPFAGRAFALERATHSRAPRARQLASVAIGRGRALRAARLFFNAWASGISPTRSAAGSARPANTVPSRRVV